MRLLIRIILFPITLVLTIIIAICRFLCGFSGALLTVVALILFTLAGLTLILLKDPPGRWRRAGSSTGWTISTMPLSAYRESERCGRV